MAEWTAGLVTAIWLGILTSISPCPLATNIAAISFVGKRVGSPRAVFGAGMLYTLGRMVTYLLLGGLIVASLLETSTTSLWLQRNMNRLLGPVLILVGMILLEMIRLPIGRGSIAARLQSRAESQGVWGAGFLGIVFALTFCPVSAALFFGSLIPLATGAGSAFALPLAYGFGTALPVFLFALLLAYGARSVARNYERLKALDRWSRRITGVVFIAIGIYLALRYIFAVF